jgi:ribulose-5-phosphate 4-epimerase/fuculose-1-phosphate aldolase
VLLKGHGVVAVGADVPSAVCRTLYLEQAARQQLWASTLGTPEVLPLDLREYHTRVGWTGGAFLWHQLVWDLHNPDARS